MRSQRRAFIIGCGRIAGGYNDADDSQPLTHAVAYRHHGVEVAGCADLDADRAQRFARRWGIPEYGTDLRDLLSSTAPDVVSICTPPSAQEGVVDAVLAVCTPSAIIIEKPLGDNPASAARLQDRLQEWGGAVIVNYFRSFDPRYVQIGAAVKNQALGVFRQAICHYSGEMKSNASHFLDLVVEWLGDPGTVRHLAGGVEAPAFLLGYEGRARVYFLPTTDLSFRPFDLELFFTRGKIRISESEKRAEWWAATTAGRYAGESELKKVREVELTEIGDLTVSVGAALDAGPQGRATTDRLATSARVTALLGRIEEQTKLALQENRAWLSWLYSAEVPLFLNLFRHTDP